MNGGMVIAEILKEEGVRHVFTLCGGHISPILVGCKNEGIKVIDCRHEVTAVFAADASARITGIPGVAIVTAGPGVTNTITALVNALHAQTPMVLLGGAAATVLKGRGSLQDIDQLGLLKAAVKRTLTIRKNCDIIPVVQSAFRIARSGVQGPVFVECPIDLLYDEKTVREMYGTKSGGPAAAGLRTRILNFYLRRHVDRMFACDLESVKLESIPTAEKNFSRHSVGRVAAMVARAERPLMIVGSQALTLPREAASLAGAVRRLGVPVYLTGTARGLLGANDPIQFRHRRKDALRDADLVILAGVPCDFRLNYGRDISGHAKLVSINRSRRDMVLNRRPDVGIHTDPSLFLRALGEAFPRGSTDRASWLAALHGRELEREAEIDSLSGESGDLVNPVLLLKKIAARMGEKSIIVADGGDFVGTASYILRPPAPLSWLDPGVFGTLGVGGGFAIGASLCRPEREIWIIYGDGAAGYSIQEFDTFARHGIPVIAIIGNDACWSQIYRDQVEILGDPVGTELNYSDYQRVAEAYGGAGFVISSAGEIDAVLDAALDALKKGKPVIVNAKISKTDFRKGSISM
ncbi:MAG: thiamine pyrophosphate-binding protein [Spirochaetes bacterium]|nr:thiamine pyrophosphate-binding protein [Spirochaetota bacterium]